MPSRLPLTALLLAGGKSVRMGRDKTLLPYAGGTLRSHMISRLEAICGETLLCGPGGIADLHPGIGPLAGLEAGLRVARHEWCLLVGCDMPDFSAPLVELLWKEAQAGDAAVVLPQGPGGREPLHALVHRRALPAIERAIANGRYGLEQALQEAGARVVPWERVRAICPDGSCFHNWNSPADLPQGVLR